VIIETVAGNPGTGPFEPDAPRDRRWLASASAWRTTQLTSARIRASFVLDPKSTATDQSAMSVPIRQRVFAYAFAALVTGAMAWPAFIDPADDSFPLSTFPMFSHYRPKEMTVTHALGVTRDGGRRPLPPLISAGNRGVLQSQVSVIRGIQTDAAGYCREVVERVKASDEHDDIVAVELATSLFDTIAYFESSSDPLDRRVHMRCEVDR